jgi:hypothetical protein
MEAGYGYLGIRGLMIRGFILAREPASEEDRCKEQAEQTRELEGGEEITF